jgi:hypothetical protein
MEVTDKASINFLIPQNGRIFGQFIGCEILKKESASCSWLLVQLCNRSEVR